jgi:hypothetical protein
MSKSYIGIDNGVSGALALLTSEGAIETLAMPLQKTRKGNEIDVVEVWRKMKIWTFEYHDVTVVIEEPGGSTSAKAATSMAGAFHSIRAIMMILGLPLIRITPPQWQKPFLKCKTGDTKPVALQMAKSLYPSLDLRASDKCRVPDSGIVDALLIATWAKRNNL